MSLPSAVRAIGLGDIRVDSALNEPLSAQIDIVGATRDELAALTAKVASREIFQRYGADRPSFLSSATFKIGLDSQGHPVLNIRSNESFTDPLVSFLVDLRWGNGELIREYSLLLDPAGFNHTPDVAVASTGTVAAPVVTVAAPGAATADTSSPDAAIEPRSTASAPVLSAAPIASGDHDRYRVSAHDTLRAIARRAGAVTESHIQRMMIAIFRANPNAFEGNINRLRLGAVITLPTAGEVAAIPNGDATREVREHMTAWRLNGRPVVRRFAAVPAPAAAAFAAPVAKAADAAPVAKNEDDAAIKSRLQTLERQLDDVHKELANEHAKIQDLRHATERVAGQKAPDAQATEETPSSSTVQAAEVTKPVLATVAPWGSASGKSLIATLATGLGLLVAGFVYLSRRKPKFEPHPYDVVTAEERLAELSKSEAQAPVAVAPAPVVADPAPAPVARPVEAVKRPAPARAAVPAPVSPMETTVDLAVDAEALERSYLDSLAINSLGIDTSILDSGALDTASHDLSDVHASTMDTAEHDTTGLETIAVDTSELDTEIRKEDLHTAVLDVKAFNAHAYALTKTELDYNLLDLDGNGQHVHMPSKLHDRVEVAERRTNIADVLKAAIERDPLRRDLRMKLLETYYSAASMNQRAFMDIVRRAARERDYLSPEDWAKVKMMGREIAAGDSLFLADSKEDDLADCA